MYGKHRTPSSVPGLHRFVGGGRHRRWLPAPVRAHRKLTASVVALLLGRQRDQCRADAVERARFGRAGYVVLPTPATRAVCDSRTRAPTSPSPRRPGPTRPTSWSRPGAPVPARTTHPAAPVASVRVAPAATSSGVVSTTAGATFAVMVRQRGAYDGQTPSNAYGFAGEGGATIAQGSGGGGLSGVFLGSGAITATSTARAVVVAGGGGGGGGRPCNPCYSLRRPRGRQLQRWPSHDAGPERRLCDQRHRGRRRWRRVRRR